MQCAELCREYSVTAPKCLFVVTHYLPLVGGGQTVYDALCRALPDHFQVLTSYSDYVTGDEVVGYKEFDASAPYEIKRLRRTRPNIGAPKVTLLNRLKGFFRSRRIERELVANVLETCRSDDIDVICIGAAEAFTWLPATLKEHTQIPIIYYTHGEEFSQTAHSAKADDLRRSAIAHSDVVVCVSSFTRDLLIDKYGANAEQISLIHNGVDFERFSTKVENNPFVQAQNKTVVAAGRMVERKGFDQLIAAWPDVLDQVPDAKLKIAGKGPIFDQLAAKIEQLSLSGSVSQLGYVSDDDLVALYQSADLFVMPNRTLDNGDTEGFGLVFLEAAAAGATSVGGQAGGAVDAIVNDETGLLVNSKDPKAIAEAVAELLLDEHKRQKMAKSAFEHARRSDWSAKANQFLELVRGLSSAADI